MFAAEIISFPKGALDDTYDDYVILDFVRTRIGYVRQDFYGRFYGIVFDVDNDEFQSAYVADGALVAAIMDLAPRLPKVSRNTTHNVPGTPLNTA